MVLEQTFTAIHNQRKLQQPERNQSWMKINTLA